jgi:hypothetical protein
MVARRDGGDGVEGRLADGDLDYRFNDGYQLASAPSLCRAVRDQFGFAVVVESFEELRVRLRLKNR